MLLRYEAYKQLNCRASTISRFGLKFSENTAIKHNSSEKLHPCMVYKRHIFPRSDLIVF